MVEIQRKMYLHRKYEHNSRIKTDNPKNQLYHDIYDNNNNDDNDDDSNNNRSYSSLSDDNMSDIDETQSLFTNELLGGLLSPPLASRDYDSDCESLIDNEYMLDNCMMNEFKAPTAIEVEELNNYLTDLPSSVSTIIKKSKEKESTRVFKIDIKDGDVMLKHSKQISVEHSGRCIICKKNDTMVVANHCGHWHCSSCLLKQGIETSSIIDDSMGVEWNCEVCIKNEDNLITDKIDKKEIDLTDDSNSNNNNNNNIDENRKKSYGCKAPKSAIERKKAIALAKNGIIIRIKREKKKNISIKTTSTSLLLNNNNERQSKRTIRKTERLINYEDEFTSTTTTNILSSNEINDQQISKYDPNYYKFKIKSVIDYSARKTKKEKKTRKSKKEKKRNASKNNSQKSKNRVKNNSTTTTNNNNLNLQNNSAYMSNYLINQQFAQISAKEEQDYREWEAVKYIKPGSIFGYETRLWNIGSIDGRPSVLELRAEPNTLQTTNSQNGFLYAGLCVLLRVRNGSQPRIMTLQEKQAIERRSQQQLDMSNNAYCTCGDPNCSQTQNYRSRFLNNNNYSYNNNNNTPLSPPSSSSSNDNSNSPIPVPTPPHPSTSDNNNNSTSNNHQNNNGNNAYYHNCNHPDCVALAMKYPKARQPSPHPTTQKSTSKSKSSTYINTTNNNNNNMQHHQEHHKQQQHVPKNFTNVPPSSATNYNNTSRPQPIRLTVLTWQMRVVMLEIPSEMLHIVTPYLQPGRVMWLCGEIMQADSVYMDNQVSPPTVYEGSNMACYLSKSIDIMPVIRTIHPNGLRMLSSGKLAMSFVAWLQQEICRHAAPHIIQRTLGSQSTALNNNKGNNNMKQTTTTTSSLQQQQLQRQQQLQQQQLQQQQLQQQQQQQQQMNMKKRAASCSIDLTNENNSNKRQKMENNTSMKGKMGKENVQRKEQLTLRAVPEFKPPAADLPSPLDELDEYGFSPFTLGSSSNVPMKTMTT